MGFNPDLNPYVSKMEEHKDIIKKLPVESNGDFLEFIKLSKYLVLDLGCGAGNFLRDYALRDQNRQFVGFELRFKRLVKGAIKLKKRDLTNVRLVQSRAEDLKLWLQGKKANEIYVNFPDPWPKKRHLKHRMMSEPFMMTVKELLEPEDGFLVFKTDHQSYFQVVKELIDGLEDFIVTEISYDLHNSEYNESNIYTEFESLFKGKGYPVYYLKTKLRNPNV